MSSIFKHDKARTTRERKGISREEVAAAVGKSGSTVYNWEVGVAEPSVSDYYRLCRVLEVDPAALVERPDLKVVRKK